MERVLRNGNEESGTGEGMDEMVSGEGVAQEERWRMVGVMLKEK